jgi:hypothetical protein
MTRIRPITLALLASALILSPLAAQAAKSTMFTAHLSGRDFVPARDTHAVGNARFNLSTDGTQLDYRLNVSNIDNVIGAELRLAPAGSDGPVVAVLYGPVAPGGGRKSGPLTEGQITSATLTGPLAGQPLSALIDAIEAGTIFVVVRTDDGQGAPDEKSGDFSSGEIRGQVK